MILFSIDNKKFVPLAELSMIQLLEILDHLKLSFKSGVLYQYTHYKLQKSFTCHAMYEREFVVSVLYMLIVLD